MDPSNHPQPRVLKAFATGTLDAADAAVVRAHLKTCAACARLVHGDATEPIPPELLTNPDYTDIQELSRGGMGVVYKAHNILMDRDEVLKVMSRDIMANAGSGERFRREIQSAARLDHSNIVRAYTAWMAGDLLVFSMEFVPGDELGKLVRARGPLPLPNACFYAQQVANALQHAHEKGMVHRDIKPANLILYRQGKKHTVKVLDFGLAKVASETGNDGGLTGQGMMLGTPDFIAPEQITNAQSADIRADIYALGCTLYFLLTGTTPFRGTSLYELLRKHQEQAPPWLSLARPDAPAELAAVASKMMAKDPAARFQTPGEVAKALVPFLKPGAVIAEAIAVGPNPIVDPSPLWLPTQVSASLEPFVKGGSSSGKARETVVEPTEDDQLAAIFAAKTIAPAPGKAGSARPSPKVPTIFTQKTEYKAPKPRRSREESEPGRKGMGLWIALGAGGIGLVGLILMLVVMNMKSRDDTTNRDTSFDTKSIESPRPALPKGPVGKGPLTPKDPVGKGPPTPKDPVSKDPPTPKDPVGKDPPTPKDPVGKDPPTPKDPVGKGPPTPKDPVSKDPPTPKDPVGKGPPAGEIAVGEPVAGSVRRFEIAPGVFMEFCWIPPGEAQLGSPKDEQDYITKTFFEGKRPEFLDAETESHRGRKPFAGFWLGKYTVTQAEWESVMGSNPSRFQPGGQGKEALQKDSITDTSRFPVECVCWDDPLHPEFSCQKFLEKINTRDGIEKVFGKGASFKLPHEDQWEYACRGNRGNTRAFYFGNVLNGTQANCDGNIPYGTTTKVQYLKRTCAVDFTNGGRYEKHPWGLFHMSGNVNQWCSNMYDSKTYVRRGGSWNYNARNCRSASRNGGVPVNCYNVIGFRVCLPLER